MKINSVLIVGGGSSGWMTAAGLIKQLPWLKVSLVESPNIPIIGVGESTIGQINTFFKYINLKDEDWMKHCNATYKTSIKFLNFRENPTQSPHVFHYPFGKFDFNNKPRMIMEWFIKKANTTNLDPYTFSEFYHDSILMTDKNKLTKNEDGKIQGFDFETDTAYHMDATMFGIYLRDNICLPSGLKHIKEDITEIKRREDGSIDYLVTSGGVKLEADLYIDCTGFKSMLLEETMGVEFVSFHDTLMNDSAIATIIPYVDKEYEMESVTSCTAIESGWVWNIPLWNRIGTGYVYSSKFATKEEAELQFRNHLKSKNMRVPGQIERADSAEFRHIKIKHGVHKKSWEKNVVGIGLSMGFIEPLESTGLMLTHEGIIKLIQALQTRNGTVTKFDIDSYNFAFYDQIIQFKHFISLHYALSMRDDTPYWKHISNNVVYSEAMNNYTPTLSNPYALMAYNTYQAKSYASEHSGIIYIAAGMGYNCVNRSQVENFNVRYKETDFMSNKVWEDWLVHKNEVLEHIETLPTQYQFLKDTIYKES